MVYYIIAHHLILRYIALYINSEKNIGRPRPRCRCPGSALGRLSFLAHSIGGFMVRAALPMLSEFAPKMGVLNTAKEEMAKFNERYAAKRYVMVSYIMVRYIQWCILPYTF